MHAILYVLIHYRSERKNVNLPGVVVDLPTLTEKDVDDLIHWAIPNDIDFIAASFVRKGSDLDHIRNVRRGVKGTRARWCACGKKQCFRGHLRMGEQVMLLWCASVLAAAGPVGRGSSLAEHMCKVGRA